MSKLAFENIGYPSNLKSSWHLKRNPLPEDFEVPVKSCVNDKKHPGPFLIEINREPIISKSKIFSFFIQSDNRPINFRKEWFQAFFEAFSLNVYFSRKEPDLAFVFFKKNKTLCLKGERYYSLKLEGYDNKIIIAREGFKGYPLQMHIFEENRGFRVTFLVPVDDNETGSELRKIFEMEESSFKSTLLFTNIRSQIIEFQGPYWSWLTNRVFNKAESFYSKEIDFDISLF